MTLVVGPSNLPVVTVVVPTRNSERTLQQCLASIRSQTYPALELIVIDNSSSDRSADIARHAADLVHTFGPERSSQRNLGVRLSKGEYLLFVDADMALERDVVSECVAILAKGLADGVIIPEISVGEGFWANCRQLERACYLGDDLIEAARFFRRDTFAIAGGFDEDLIGGEDWDLSRRISRGRTLPRTVSRIRHDEGRIRLGPWLTKKKYYAQSFRTYYSKHGRRSILQMNLIVRPAFIRNWRLLVNHPLLTPGLLLMKTLESAAALVGILSAQGANRKRPANQAR